MKMSCGLGSSCCDELRPAKKALRADQLDESGLCILRHSSGSDQLKKCRKLNEPNGDQEHDGDGNATLRHDPCRVPINPTNNDPNNPAATGKVKLTPVTPFDALFRGGLVPKYMWWGRQMASNCGVKGHQGGVKGRQWGRHRAAQGCHRGRQSKCGGGSGGLGVTKGKFIQRYNKATHNTEEMANAAGRCIRRIPASEHIRAELTFQLSVVKMHLRQK
ncbi:hypothetical protein B0H14DRAFT_2624277 [Mycena olivaceomarginata]|nr:hypothetical protein B0H14DRAFT_2624277 [Mycena olivaceomarginata]